MKISPGLVEYRDHLPSDIPFIYATWLKGLYYGNDWFREIDQETYFNKYHQVIEAILFHPHTEIFIACLKDDEEVVLGYSVYSNKGKDAVLHWVFIKSAWRKLGLAKSMVPLNTIECTHLTKIGKALKPEGWKFNPFI